MDRNGTSLAYNENRYNLVIEPKNILTDEKNVEATVTALVECYGYDRGELEKLIRDHPDSYYQRLDKQISEEDKQRFLDYKESYNTEKETESVLDNTAAAEESGDSSTAESEETSKKRRNQCRKGRRIRQYF